eukprot:CAMPEP_0206221590 /NCGR_PEP_ID=MMETSP0047_2-20121206/5500_1 /ASSEMBLY_ACC=CAM_ASM_000192 /TAXON_ID=195065 /ORGANISM="Chroomonas mesostigmatica_cf, Strain CCMP1168" /LENGTH=204 /DNA_ID=CAMNT_0053644343 /DNA_START=332 /DNA_END=942 /DNA_ORIENTATION=+
MKREEIRTTYTCFDDWTMGTLLWGACAAQLLVLLRMSTTENVRAKHSEVPSIEYIGSFTSGESDTSQSFLSRKQKSPDTRTPPENTITIILHLVILSPRCGLTRQRIVPPMITKHVPKMHAKMADSPISNRAASTMSAMKAPMHVPAAMESMYCSRSEIMSIVPRPLRPSPNALALTRASAVEPPSGAPLAGAPAKHLGGRGLS